MVTQTLANRLKHARRTAGLTQDQLARRCGVTRSAISQWESGTIGSIAADNLVGAAKALQVSVDWLLSGREDKVPEASAMPEDPGPIAIYWHRLTKAQQQELIERARDLAEQNAAILAELHRG